jgi:hypothetical protein
LIPHGAFAVVASYGTVVPLTIDITAQQVVAMLHLNVLSDLDHLIISVFPIGASVDNKFV